MTSTATPTLPIADIKINGNPRSDQDAGALAELVASIKEHGVLQPVLVRPVDEGHELVAGRRRLTAAKKAGLKEIPVHVKDLSGGQLAAALVENVIREDLTPVEEGEALAKLQKQEKLSLRDLGKRVGKSKDWCSARLKIVELPEKVQACVGTTVGLHEVPVLLKIAKQAPAAAEYLAPIGIDLENEWHLTQRLYNYQEQGDTGVWAPQHVRVATLPVDDAAELEKRVKKASAGVEWGYERDYVTLENKDINAARAYGCLLEFSQREFITDGVWLAEQVRPIIEKLEREAARWAKKQGKAAPAAAGGKDAEAKAKEARRKEREKEERARIAARGHNLELGVKTAKAFAKPKLTLDVVKLLALLAIGDEPDRLAMRGLGYVDEQHQVVETKNGKQKITYRPIGRDHLVKQIDKAKTPEEAAGVVIRALVCAEYASQDAVTQSSRYYKGSPPSRFGIGKLVDKIAGKAVPPALKRGRR